MFIMRAMFHIVRFTRRICPALTLALALTSCDSGTNETITTFITGDSTQEHQQLRIQLQQAQEELARLEKEIKQAESHDARINYTLQKKLANPGKLTTPFTPQDIDTLLSKRRDFEHLCFDLEDMRKNLAKHKQEYHALQYQYQAYATKLADFKQSHPID